jgi:hypothetical protein
MNFPPLGVPETAQDAIDLYKERFHSTDRRDLPLVASIQLMAYLAWPNDEARRNSWAAATVARQTTLKGPVSIPMIDMFGGLTERPSAALLDRIRDVFGFEPPRKHGHSVIESIAAMRDGMAKAVVCLGGNLR